MIGARDVGVLRVFSRLLPVVLAALVLSLDAPLAGPPDDALPQLGDVRVSDAGNWAFHVHGGSPAPVAHVAIEIDIVDHERRDDTKRASGDENDDEANTSNADDTALHLAVGGVDLVIRKCHTDALISREGLTVTGFGWQPRGETTKTTIPADEMIPVGPAGGELHIRFEPVEVYQACETFAYEMRLTTFDGAGVQLDETVKVEVPLNVEREEPLPGE